MNGAAILDIAFQVAGCAISRASASMMTQVLKGKSRAEAEKIFWESTSLVTGKEAVPDTPDLGKLKVFSGVSKFPARVKCATLAWHTLQSALDNKDTPVSTE